MLLCVIKANLSSIQYKNRICISDSCEAFKKPETFNLNKTRLEKRCSSVEMEMHDVFKQRSAEQDVNLLNYTKGQFPKLLSQRDCRCKFKRPSD